MLIILSFQNRVIRRRALFGKIVIFLLSYHDTKLKFLGIGKKKILNFLFYVHS